MTQYIGQITVILTAGSRELASAELRRFACVLEETFPDIEFADHNGDVDPYEDQPPSQLT